MPRAKIRPEDRQRCERACTACKASKVRCDSQLPCGGCMRRKKENECIYTPQDGRRRRRRRTNLLSGDDSPPGAASGESLLGVVSTTTDYDSQTRREGRLPPQQRSGYGTEFVGPRTPAQELVYAAETSPDSGAVELGVVESGRAAAAAFRDDQGEVASLSFLHFLRRTLRPLVGSTSFTDGDPDGVFHGMELDRLVDDTFSPSQELSRSLLCSYKQATEGLLDLFADDEAEHLITLRFASPVAYNEDLAALNMAMAVGAQSHPEYRSNPHIAATLFSRAHKFAFMGMLASPSTKMVRLFLLLAFFLLGAGRRNASSMYMGIAARAAVMKGLHQRQALQGLPPSEVDARIRTWNSLRVLDVLAGFIIGRPQHIPEVWHSRRCNNDSAGDSSARSAEGAFDRLARGCDSVEDIVRQLRSGNMLHYPTAENLLERLRKWIQTLPEASRNLSYDAPLDLNTDERRELMGNINISCVYYFGVMLITRPFLIAYLLSRLRGNAPHHLNANPESSSEEGADNHDISKLAQVCVGSMIYLAEMCRGLKKLGFLFGNLCLLQSWVFGSGLVLGFSMFAGEPRQDIENGFEATLDILEDMTTTSSQADVYYQILKAFSETVKQYRQRVGREVQNMVQSYVERVLVIKAPQAQHGRDIASFFDFSDFDHELIDANLGFQLGQSEESLFYTVE